MGAVAETRMWPWRKVEADVLGNGKGEEFRVAARLSSGQITVGHFLSVCVCPAGTKENINRHKNKTRSIFYFKIDFVL